METIKNTSEDNGKTIIRISNNMAFAYVFSSDAHSIDEDLNNHRYATKEEEAIYNSNKNADNRFYFLMNAPELRHETLKERIAALTQNNKIILPDSLYRIITSDMSKKYWEHELNESKDKEIADLKQQISSLIEYKDSLTKQLCDTDKSLLAEQTRSANFYKNQQRLEKSSIILIDALLDIKNWDENLEDIYEDPGFRANKALEEFKK